jgi:hypothetical protein
VRSAALRVRLAHEARVLEGPLALADAAVDGWRWLRRNPEWPMVAAAVLLLLRPKRALRLASTGWTVWKLWRAAQQLTRR